MWLASDDSDNMWLPNLILHLKHWATTTSVLILPFPYAVDLRRIILE